ncbi:MAG: NAD(P)H-hydrate dehydratase, partial [Anaerolineae bacterium]|nr:NAD(P)H-hydrate dehydratase [Anaerolineae bacterium]
TLIGLEVLAKLGWPASAYIVGERDREDVLVARCRQAGTALIWREEDDDLKQLAGLVETSDILLDGLLGTGIRLPLREPYPAVLTVVNETIQKMAPPPAVVAVDCPSGMDCDSGESAGQAIRADKTVCMAAWKQGMFKFPGSSCLGEVRLVDIGLPEDFEALASIRRFAVDGEYVLAHLPERPDNSHKGTYGTALIAAGSRNYPGAALLAGEAAYRSGAGLVNMAVPESIYLGLVGHLPEAVWTPLPDAGGAIRGDAVNMIRSQIPGASSLLFGPGFGLAPETKEFINNLLALDLPPLVVDADGLKLLAQIGGWQKKLPENTVLTPHPGEMAVLSGESKEVIQARRFETAEKYAQEWGHVLVLKGAHTVIADPQGSTAVLPLATPALARAGSGDVLAGIITGLRAQGMGTFQAAVCGVWLHGQAGKAAAAARGSTAGVIAGDLIVELPKLFPR